MDSSRHPRTSVRRPGSALGSHSSDLTTVLSHRAAVIGQPSGPTIKTEMIGGRSDHNEKSDRGVESQSPTFECTAVDYLNTLAISGSI